MSKNANSKNRTQNTYNSTNETDRTTSKNAYDSKNTYDKTTSKNYAGTLTTKTKWNKPLPLFYDTGAVPCCTCYFFT